MEDSPTEALGSFGVTLRTPKVICGNLADILGDVCGTLDVCGTGGDDEDDDDVVDDEDDDEEEDVEEDEVVEDDESEESESEWSDLICSLCFGTTVGVLTERPGINIEFAEVGDRFRFCARATSDEPSTFTVIACTEEAALIHIRSPSLTALNGLSSKSSKSSRNRPRS